jgi:hypothetical protein
MESVMIKPDPESVTPARLERRRKMVDRAKAAFPNGVPDPYTTLDLESRESLPFVRATITMLSYDGLIAHQFKDIWCLWDSGAHICHVRSVSLNPEVKSPGP